jgi:hypothetical protein
MSGSLVRNGSIYSYAVTRFGCNYALCNGGVFLANSKIYTDSLIDNFFILYHLSALLICTVWLNVRCEISGLCLYWKSCSVSKLGLRWIAPPWRLPYWWKLQMTLQWAKPRRFISSEGADPLVWTGRYRPFSRIFMQLEGCDWMTGGAGKLGPRSPAGAWFRGCYKSDTGS